MPRIGHVFRVFTMRKQVHSGMAAGLPPEAGALNLLLRDQLTLGQ